MATTLQQSQRRNIQQSSNGLTLKSIIAFIVNKWYWFVISLAVTMSIATIKIMRTPPMYSRAASLLVKDEERNGLARSSVDMSKMGLVKYVSNLENERRVITSRELMKEVVKRLDLNDRYSIKNGLRYDVIYKQSPVLFHAVNDSIDSEAVSFNFILEKDNKINISDVKVQGKKIDETFTTTFGNSLRIGDTTFEVVKPTWKASAFVGEKIAYAHTTLKAAAAAYAHALNAYVTSPKASIIDIHFTCTSVREADDVLNTLIQVYNERWIEDQNEVAVSTNKFIAERLAVIEKELGKVDSDISSFKSDNLLPDVNTASGMYMSQSAEAQANIINLSNQISIAEMVKNQLSDDNLDQPLPSNTMVNANIESAISQYNTLVIERNRLLESTKESNPIVKDRTQELRTLRAGIMASLNAYIATLRKQISNASEQVLAANGKIASSPDQAKYIMSVERQQKVKESLYMFLLQKREENELSQAFSAYNTSVVVEPEGSTSPTSPDTNGILLIAFAIGLVIPLAIFIIRELLDTKIRGKKDLSALKIPYLGEIPATIHEPHGFDRLKKHSKQEKQIVITDRSRDAVNEAFRVLRTNLEYMGIDETGANNGCKVISITSANPGSGKTFVSVNLAKVLALKGKKVLLIDLDIRKGSLSKIIGRPSKGIVDFIVGKAQEDAIIIKDVDNTPGLDAIGIGTVPPNPSELLSSEKLDRLITDMREQYDFIILDCPPVEIVTDAKVINRLVDMTIFIIRAGLLEKDELPTIQEYYDDKRYRNMAILLNATDVRSGYGYHRYGYHYGYGRNYGYGYGTYGSK